MPSPAPRRAQATLEPAPAVQCRRAQLRRATPSHARGVDRGSLHHPGPSMPCLGLAEPGRALPSLALPRQAVPGPGACHAPPCHALPGLAGPRLATPSPALPGLRLVTLQLIESLRSSITSASSALPARHPLAQSQLLAHRPQRRLDHPQTDLQRRLGATVPRQSSPCGQRH